MAEYIKKSDLEKHIIREGCDEGCGYIDERDLKNIPTYEVYGTEEVIQRLQILSDDIESLDAMGEFSKDSVLGLIQEKIKGLRLEQNND